MPPKTKFTKEQMLEIAYNSVREKGADFLSARNLAALLHTSTAPVFTAFGSIDELHRLIIEKAERLYTEEYIRKGLEMTPPFKGTGLKYIQFAKDEPELFKLLFMQKQEKVSHFLPQNDKNSEKIINTVIESYALDENTAKAVYNHMSVYTHGFAVLYAQKNCTFTLEDVNCMLTEIFTALIGYYGKKTK